MTVKDETGDLIQSAWNDLKFAERRIGELLKYIRDNIEQTSGLDGRVEEVLVRLIKAGVWRALSFDILVKTNTSVALGAIRDSLLCKEIDPDRKTGGYEADLGIILGDIVDFLGEEKLISFIRSCQLKEDRLKDPRMIRAIGVALDIDQHEASAWLSSVITASSLMDHN